MGGAFGWCGRTFPRTGAAVDATGSVSENKAGRCINAFPHACVETGCEMCARFLGNLNGHAGPSTPYVLGPSCARLPSPRPTSSPDPVPDGGLWTEGEPGPPRGPGEGSHRERLSQQVQRRSRSGKSCPRGPCADRHGLGRPLGQRSPTWASQWRNGEGSLWPPIALARRRRPIPFQCHHGPRTPAPAEPGVGGVRRSDVGLPPRGPPHPVRPSN